MNIKKIKNYGLYGCITILMIWQYASLVLVKHYKNSIISPSYLITKMGEQIKVVFYKIGELFGIVYDKTFYIIKDLSEYLRIFFSNFSYYAKIFINDITDTFTQILYPTVELIKSPTKIISGFYNKLNELSPFNIKTFVQVSLLSIAIVFGVEYVLLKYEQYKQKTMDTYSFKYKPSNLLGYISDDLQTKFTKTGKYLGNTILACSKRIVDYTQEILQFIKNIPEFIKKTFSNIYETGHRLLAPSFNIIQSPVYFITNYVSTIKNFSYGTEYFGGIVKYLPFQLTVMSVIIGVVLYYNSENIKAFIKN